MEKHSSHLIFILMKNLFLPITKDLLQIVFQLPILPNKLKCFLKSLHIIIFSFLWTKKKLKQSKINIIYRKDLDKRLTQQQPQKYIKRLIAVFCVNFVINEA